MMRRLLVVLVAVTLSACSGGSPAAPTPGPPNVVGNYSGTVTQTVTLFPNGPPATCPAQAVVNQNGSTVSFASFVLSGACAANFGSLPFGDTTISNTGALGTITMTQRYLVTCGGYYDASVTGSFVGNNFQVSIAYTPTLGYYCLNEAAALPRA
jgi:hypothetical protein